MLMYNLTTPDMISGPVIITTDGLTGEVTIVPEFPAIESIEIIPEVLTGLSFNDMHAALNFRQLTQCERDSIDMSYLVDRAYRPNGELM
jgi:hypothetical protein